MQLELGKILHASFLIADLERSLEFYTGVLGLSVNAARPDLGYPGAWLQLDEDQQIHLLQLPNPDLVGDRPAHGGRDRHVALAVNSIAALVEQLAANDVPYSLSKSGRRALFCRDPDGNALEFVEI